MPLPSLTRRRALQQAWLTLGFQPLLSRAQSATQAVAAPLALRALSLHAIQQQQALVVMVSLKGCPWCDFVRHSHLQAMQRERGTVFADVDMGSDTASVLDFMGRRSSGRQLAQAWNVRRAPTLLFLGADGQELAPRLVGVASQDYYGVYLEQRLETAHQALVSHSRS